MGNFRGITNTNILSKKQEGQAVFKPAFKTSVKADKEFFPDEPEKIPPPAPIEPAPEVDDDQAAVSGSRRRKRGRQSTVLTGDLAPEQKKKTTLG